MLIHEQWFDASPSSAGGVRRFVTGVVHDDPRSMDTLELAVSELATNAIVHGRGRFLVRVERRPGTVRVEIEDPNPALPSPERPDPEAVRGRGLDIVDRVTTRWGVTPTDQGKVVWFEVPRQDT